MCVGSRVCEIPDRVCIYRDLLIRPCQRLGRDIEHASRALLCGVYVQSWVLVRVLWVNKVISRLSNVYAQLRVAGGHVLIFQNKGHQDLEHVCTQLSVVVVLIISKHMSIPPPLSPEALHYIRLCRAVS